jgi:uncharacterized protein YodC (DUF2158 family)
MIDIKPGDAVRLKAKDNYAPVLTVESLQNGLAQCLWFKANNLERAVIRIEALRKVDV